MDKFSLNQRAVALMMVLATLLVVVILANVVLTIVSSQSRLSHHQISRIRAYYAALGAMNLALERLRTGNTADFTLCRSGCTYNDPDIPYPVNVRIGDLGSGVSGTRRIDISVNYTYTP